MWGCVCVGGGGGGGGVEKGGGGRGGEEGEEGEGEVQGEEEKGEKERRDTYIYIQFLRVCSIYTAMYTLFSKPHCTLHLYIVYEQCTHYTITYSVPYRVRCQ